MECSNKGIKQSSCPINKQGIPSNSTRTLMRRGCKRRDRTQCLKVWPVVFCEGPTLADSVFMVWPQGMNIEAITLMFLIKMEWSSKGWDYVARKITKEIHKQMKVLHQHFLIHWKIRMLPHYQIKFCGNKIQNSVRGLMNRTLLQALKMFKNNVRVKIFEREDLKFMSSKPFISFGNVLNDISL